ncbi:serine hydrolase [Nordella sp. HKS 07]|uniref:serine hydrolase n=1 Tax=Nordella sp. HKS 07 TaxID=2712222 RepID=UPI0013E1373D|nr:serine hydrolase [Nordella sp. HKS 07]QIG50535.1 serine hydrolase [Nordella sp. HKS 07]
MSSKNYPSAETLGTELVAWIAERFASHGVARDHFAVTLHLHAGEGGPVAASFSYRGDVPFYPCSVVKIFYMVALQQAYEDGRLIETPELSRAMHDMIKWSSNMATNYIIDHLSRTTGDLELSAVEMERWVEARENVNLYFHSLGLKELAGINVSQKLMDDERYGREKIYVQRGGNNHNRLSSDAAAVILARIMSGTMISAERSRIMRETLYRPNTKEFRDTPNAQLLAFLGESMPEGARIWSKAGWTGWTGDALASYRRHDALHAVLPGGEAFTLVVFTQGKWPSESLIMLPEIAAKTVALISG